MYKKSKIADTRINILKVFSREVLLYSSIKTLQKISKLLAFNTRKALTKMHVMLLTPSAMKAKLVVGLSCQNFLSGYRIHGGRFINSHLLHHTICSAGKQRFLSFKSTKIWQSSQALPSPVPNKHTANQCGFSDVAEGIF